MMTVRRGADRGRADLGWLQSWFTFSFADYHDPEHMGFRALRVINEDCVRPGTGFGSHPHRDMEILTYMIDGTLEHTDSLGNGSVIRAGEVQRMTAGTGVTHSEYNPSEAAASHLLQIWIHPDTPGLEPGYEQARVDVQAAPGEWHVIAAPRGNGGAVCIHQDVRVSAARLDAGQDLAYTLAPDRYAWVQVVAGAVTLNATTLEAGDGAAVTEETTLAVSATEPAEVLLFDLA